MTKAIIKFEKIVRAICSTLTIPKNNSLKIVKMLTIGIMKCVVVNSFTPRLTKNMAGNIAIIVMGEL